MSRDPLHITNPDWVLFDPVDETSPDFKRPQAGEEILMVNEGGKLIIGQWYPGAIAWGHKPKIPASVKARMSAQTKARLSRGNK